MYSARLTPTPSSRAISVPAVYLERRFLGKPGLTVGAFERPQARVCPLMQRQGGFGAEGLSTVGADVFQVAAFMDLTCSRETEDQLRDILFDSNNRV